MPNFLVLHSGLNDTVMTRTDVMQSVMRNGSCLPEDVFVVGEKESFASWKRLRDEGRLTTVCTALYPVSFLLAMVKGLEKGSWITLCLGQDGESGVAMPLMLQVPIGVADSEIRMLLAPSAAPGEEDSPAAV